jgi:thioredoxin-related protein
VGTGDHSEVVIAFLSARCKGCRQIRPLLGEVAGDVEQVLVVFNGDVEATGEYVQNMPAEVLAVSDANRELAKLWRVHTTPFFVIVDERGRVRRKGVGGSVGQVKAFFARQTTAVNAAPSEA